MSRISAKHQLTIPVSALAESGLRSGEEVVVDVVGDGELRVRRAGMRFQDAFGALGGVYPPDYLARLDAEDEER